MIDLSVRGLVKGFEQGNDILKGITFDVNAGERVGILGRNGCGKTTFSASSRASCSRTLAPCPSPPGGGWG